MVAFIAMLYIKDPPLLAKGVSSTVERYKREGRYKKVEALCQYTLMLYKCQPDKDHLVVATTLDDLAMLYRAQGKYEAAEPLYQHALAIMKAKFPVGHPDLDKLQKNYEEMKAQQAGK
jgi:tetratricopeptide (TPR) repeat protein